MHTRGFLGIFAYSLALVHGFIVFNSSSTFNSLSLSLSLFVVEVDDSEVSSAEGGCDVVALQRTSHRDNDDEIDGDGKKDVANEVRVKFECRGVLRVTAP